MKKFIFVSLLALAACSTGPTYQQKYDEFVAAGHDHQTSDRAAVNWCMTYGCNW